LLTYNVTANSKKGGKASAKAKESAIVFDASSGRDQQFPNPAELLLSSFAACVLKNVERFSELLHFDYKTASIKVKGWRQDRPPMMSKITYVLEIDSDMDLKKLNLLHKNILKFGTITNTLAQVVELSGKIKSSKD
jgi:uncharacterized OsmC-like protein